MDSLSIILLNHNTYQLTCNCLESIYNSNIGNIDLQIIVVDNGSTEHHVGSFKDLFEDIIYIKTETNVGFAKGNNIGLQHATKSYVVLLNSDTLISDPDTFTKTIEVVKRYDNKIVLTTQLLTGDRKPQVAYGFIPNLTYEFILTSFFYKLFSKEKAAELLIDFVPNENRLINGGYITATYLLFPKNILELMPEGKLYDNTFMYGEELFWSTIWFRNSIAMYYFADVSIIHLIGQSSKQLKSYNVRLRRTYQLNAENDFLCWRYKKFTVFLIYFLRVIRYLIISPFDKDIRLRLSLLPNVIFKSRKYS